MKHPYSKPRSPLTLDELQKVLRPAGGGVYVVSTGLSEQRSLQKRIYHVKHTDEVEQAWKKTLQKAHQIDHLQRGQRLLLLGVPSDTGAGFTRGANLAPSTLRAHLLSHYPDHPLIGPHSFDIGDVRVVPQLLSAEMLSDEQYRATALALFGEVPISSLPVTPLDITYEALRAFSPVKEDTYAVTPIVIGGDHSVGWPAFKAAYDRWEATGKARLGLLHFDAHTDLLSERLGVKYCFATWAWHANQLFGQDGRLAQVGIRASARDRAHWETTCNVRQYWANEVHQRGADEIAHDLIERFERLGVTALYVSNDIDGTDEKYASATGTPESGGLTPEQVNLITARVGERFPLIGADLVEVAPPLSRTEGEPETTLNTASSYLELLGKLALQRTPIS